MYQTFAAHCQMCTRLSFQIRENIKLVHCCKIIDTVHVPNFGGCQGRRTGVGVTIVSNSLILGGWMTKVLKNGDEK